jgi:hypothetical protein
MVQSETVQNTRDPVKGTVQEGLHHHQVLNLKTSLIRNMSAMLVVGKISLKPLRIQRWVFIFFSSENHENLIFPK